MSSSVSSSGGSVPTPSSSAVTATDGAIATLGATTDAEAAAGNGTLIAIAKRNRTLLGLISAAVGGTLAVSISAIAVALPSGTNHTGAVNVDTVQVNYQHADSCIGAQGGKTLRDSVRLPAVSGKRHYVTFIDITLTDTLALAPAATVAAKTNAIFTNLPSFNVQMGQTLGLGNQLEWIASFTWPVRSLTANTVTEIKMPVPTSAGGYWSITACYLLGP